MANEKFKVKKGEEANLPSIEAGSLIITTDTKKLYADISNTERVQIGNSGSESVDIPIYTIDDPYTLPLSANIYRPSEFVLNTSSDGSQLIIIDFESGNRTSYPGFYIDGATFGCLNEVLITSQPFSALFLIPALNDTQIKFLGSFNHEINYDDIILKYDQDSETLSHNKQLKTGSEGVKYGSVPEDGGEITNGDIIYIPQIKVDEYGHIISIQDTEGVFSFDLRGSIKLFSEDSDPNTFISDISNQELIDGDLILIKFSHDKAVLPNATFGTLNGKNYIVTQLFGANAYTYVLFKVVSIATSNANGVLLSIGQINQPITTTDNNDPIQITYSANSTTTTIKHKEILNTGEPDITYGSLVTGTDLKKTISVPEVSVDKYGHIVNIQETSVNANYREDAFTDQTSAQYRNIVVVPSSTDLSTLDVPVGTIIFVKN